MNPNVWHMKVSLVVYDRVLQQFGFRQYIPMAPKDLDDVHPINLRGQTKLACDLNYMLWFRIHGKPYLYREETSILDVLHAHAIYIFDAYNADNDV
ncbi:hypothetical protein PVK06_027441 [Gossypium arboreum]|uniref:Uncharacterized protein n=1 Tax=Gossypium arboreum TaxID=29729 RepID=A0ABR0P0A8_GOSAR|nr:hypothetical protein PVK06_027441 [Gossypium arboreum]